MDGQMELREATRGIANELVSPLPHSKGNLHIMVDR